MEAEKIVGWILLFFGLTIIFWMLYSSFNIFTGKNPYPEIFKFETSLNLPSKTGENSIEQLQKEVGKVFEEQLKGFLPADSFPKILNLTAWAILAGIFIFAGGQVSNIGINLIKK